MADDKDALARELANIIRDNKELFASELNRRFVAEYPRARANLRPRADIEEWTMRAIQEMADYMESGDLPFIDYRRNVGDALFDPHNQNLTFFASTILTLHFDGRVYAPILFNLAYSRNDAIDLLELFEERLQAAIRWNTEMYQEEVCRPGALRSEWDLYGIHSPSSREADTPAKRYMAPERYDKVVRNSRQDPYEPAGDKLTRRERRVLDLVLDGRTNGEIAGVLGISENTVKHHVGSIFDKYNVSSRSELILRTLSRD